MVEDDDGSDILSTNSINNDASPTDAMTLTCPPMNNIHGESRMNLEGGAVDLTDNDENRVLPAIYHLFGDGYPGYTRFFDHDEV